MVDNELKIELRRLSPLKETTMELQIYFWMPHLKGYLKLNMDVRFKDNSTTSVVLAYDEVSKV